MRKAASIERLIALTRNEHHPDSLERHSCRRVQHPCRSCLSHRLEAQAGRVLYASRKQAVEPVFGIINLFIDFSGSRYTV